jgi:hypothetical protein
MRKTTIVASVVLATAGGGSLAAFARASVHDDRWPDRSSRAHSSSSNAHQTRMRNWNALDSEALNRIRIPIRNNNSIVNVAPSRPTATVTTTMAPTV